MSLVINPEGSPVHYPKRDVFEFDAEVAAIFENMAQRSIPMYPEVHRLHVSLLMPKIASGDCTISDIGASTGKLFRTLRTKFEVASLAEVKGLKCYAYDNSFPMLEKLRAEFPEVNSSFLDVSAPTVPHAPSDIVTMFYVLQFIEPARKYNALQWIFDNLKGRGVLVLGQKDRMDSGNDDAFQDEYVRFRLANGYTMEEIQAKTAALKGAQWLLTQPVLVNMLLEIGFSRVYETTRWLNFSTIVAHK